MTNSVDVGALQRARKSETRSRLLEAFDAIEREVLGQGFYSENDGKVTLKEVARKAGLSSTTLRNIHHRDTRDLLRARIDSLGKQGAVNKKTARAVSRDKLAFYEDALKRVNSEAVRWRMELKALRDENRELRKSLERYTKGENIIAIRGREND